jgi:hypothetical protein
LGEKENFAPTEIFNAILRKIDELKGK